MRSTTNLVLATLRLKVDSQQFQWILGSWDYELGDVREQGQNQSPYRLDPHLLLQKILRRRIPPNGVT